MPGGRRLKHRKLSRHTRRRVIIGIILSCVLILVIYINAQISALVATSSDFRIRTVGHAALTQAVAQTLEGRSGMQDMVIVSHDGQGRISLLQVNTIMMNEITAEVTAAFQRIMRESSEQTIELPLGNILGIPWLNNWGPRWPVNIHADGSVMIQYSQSFESTGINQTLHTIMMQAELTMRARTPSGIFTVSQAIDLPVLQSIIIGDVPQSLYQNSQPMLPLD